MLWMVLLLLLLLLLLSFVQLHLLCLHAGLLLYCVCLKQNEPRTTRSRDQV
jgi:hypothetical protein